MKKASKPKLSIIKIGGGIIEDPILCAAFCNVFIKVKGPKILVHGGGKSATHLAEKLHLKTQMIQGRRVTPLEHLKVVTMTYAGWANKEIVAKLQSLGCNALGLSGADGNSVLAKKRNPVPVDYGFVGDIIKINDSFIGGLITQDFIPVFCALTHNGAGQLLNTNADTIAAEIAIAMTPFYHTSLWYCFDKKGVLSNLEKETVMPSITLRDMELGIQSGTLHAGMLPKLSNGFNALNKGVAQVGIGDNNMLENKGPFTLLKH